MCLCESCDCLDNWCCSLKRKVWAFAIWTIIFGILVLISSVVQFIHFDNLDATEYKDDEYYKLTYALNFNGHILSIVLACITVLAGLLMLYSIKESIAPLYMATIVVGSICPFGYTPLVIVPIVQVLFIIIGCRYYSTVLK